MPRIKRRLTEHAQPIVDDNSGFQVVPTPGKFDAMSAAYPPYTTEFTDSRALLGPSLYGNPKEGFGAGRRYEMTNGRPNQSGSRLASKSSIPPAIGLPDQTTGGMPAPIQQQFKPLPGPGAAPPSQMGQPGMGGEYSREGVPDEEMMRTLLKAFAAKMAAQNGMGTAGYR